MISIIGGDKDLYLCILYKDCVCFKWVIYEGMLFRGKSQRVEVTVMNYSLHFIHNLSLSLSLKLSSSCWIMLNRLMVHKACWSLCSERIPQRWQVQCFGYLIEVLILLISQLQYVLHLSLCFTLRDSWWGREEGYGSVYFRENKRRRYTGQSWKVKREWQIVTKEKRKNQQRRGDWMGGSILGMFCWSSSWSGNTIKPLCLHQEDEECQHWCNPFFYAVDAQQWTTLKYICKSDHLFILLFMQCGWTTVNYTKIHCKMFILYIIILWCLSSLLAYQIIIIIFFIFSVLF